MHEKTLSSSIAASLRGSWKAMVVADIFYKLLAFMVLTPLFSMLFRALLLIRGNAVLSDVDIALFFAGPFGWVSAIAIGAVWLAILALEQASLLAIVAARSYGKQLGTIGSLRFASNRCLTILRVAGRLIAATMVVIAPVLVFSIVVYYWTLSDYDINYYLDERPLIFKIVVGAVAIMLTGLVTILLRLYAGWFLALPLVAFDGVSPNAALSKSRQIVAGNRLRVLRWIVAWLVFGLVVNTLATLLIGVISRWLIPTTLGSLAVMSGRVGIMLIMFSIVSLILNLIGTIGFTLILFHAYQSLHPHATATLDGLEFSNSIQLDYRQLVSRKRIMAICLVGCIFAAYVGASAINSLQLADRVQVMAHRGASKNAPENSLAAMEKAIDAGADWVEIDVQETADGEVVVIHDSDLMKLARNKIKIWNATMNDLRAIDIGSSFDPQYADQRVPTLDEVLKLCNGKIGVIIELKYYGHDKHLEQRVVEVVENNGMANKVMMMSLKPEGVKKMKAIRPSWKYGVLLSVVVGNTQKIDADFLAINAKFVTRSLIKTAHKSGKEVYVWTVDDTTNMSAMMNRGVDGILTNRPELARNVLQQRTQMSSTERLLTELASLLGAEPMMGEQ